MQSACKEQTLRSEHAKQSPIYIFALRTTLQGGQVAGWSKSLPPATIYLSFACSGNPSFKKKNFNPRLCFVQVGQTKQLKGNNIMKVISDENISANSNELEELLRLKIDREVKNQIHEVVTKVMQTFNQMELARHATGSSDMGDRVLLCQYLISTLNPYQLPELENSDEIINRIKDMEFFDQINTLAGNLKSL
jgi:uncharacterized protein YlzI (FlbEa/FlbD family)